PRRADPRITALPILPTGASAPVFFVPPHISRCGKFFCVVKNHAAWHNPGDCGMENSISYPEIEISRY
ncbi:hypothetical protein K6X08_38490, partial [Burkholderia contaminans]|uniref:hypothetical protein n=2 Tax=Burkholderia TaxID=32008 RepID=UPI001C961088